MTPPALRGPLPCRFEVKNLRPFPHLALDFVILQFVDKHGVKSFDVVSYSFEPRNTQRGQVAASTRLDWRRVWHFQMVHHGLWDYDLPSAPNLIDIRVNGKDVKAVAQVSKQGFCYVFDRVTDKPIWPNEEARSPVAGARREDVPDAARSDQARSLRPTGSHGERRNQLNAGAAQSRRWQFWKVQLRSAVHAAFSRQADDRDARYRRAARVGQARRSTLEPGYFRSHRSRFHTRASCPSRRYLILTTSGR
jgi:hypothetical protein